MLILRSLAAGLLFLAALPVAAQSTDSSASPGKNQLKINLSALVFTNISLQYERQIGRKTTVALGVNTRPFGTLPYKSLLKKAVNEDAVNLDKLKLGITGITPEFRFYTGRKGAMRGFYLGPFFSYHQYKSDLPIKYDNDTKDGVFSGTLKSYTFGLQLGAQWKLGKNVHLDWWIIGPNYGSAQGDLVFAGALSPSDQADMIDEIETLKDDLPVKAIESYQVGPNGASIKVKGPWAGLRGMGFCVGYRF